MSVKLFLLLIILMVSAVVIDSVLKKGEESDQGMNVIGEQ